MMHCTARESRLQKSMQSKPVCYKKQQKESFWPVTGLWNRGPLKILNGIKFILGDQGNHLDLLSVSLLQQTGSSSDSKKYAS